MNTRHGSLVPAQAVVRKKTFETDSVCSLTVALTGRDDFRFSPGEFNMLGLPGFGEAPFSFSTLKLADNTFTHTIRRAGEVTKALLALSPGDTLHLRGPYGNGWPLERVSGRPLILVAGGIGMAPLRPVLQHIFRHREDFADIFLLIGGRDSNHLLFKDDLRQWNTDKRVSVLPAVDQKPGLAFLNTHVGLVTDLLDTPGIPLREAVTFTCGPEIMMRFVTERLIDKGQDPGNIYISLERRMRCGTATCGHCQIGPRYVCKDGPVFCYSDIHGLADTLL